MRFRERNRSMSVQQPSNPAPDRPPTDTSGQGQPPAGNQPPPNQRDARGRFTAGNRGGTGNPFARQSAALRRALLNAVTDQDISDITAALLDKARQGDVAAAKLVFSYTLGKPAAAVDPDTLDQQELKNLAGNHVGVEAVQHITNTFPIDMLLAMIHAMLPHLEAAKAQSLAEQLAAQDAEEVANDSEAEAPGTPAAPPTAAPATLEETVRAWEEEVQQLKAQLNATPTPPAAAEVAVPAESGAAAEPGRARSSQPRWEQPQHPRASDSGKPPWEEGRYRPSTNGSNGELSST
jgi:hypothetical protein